MIGNETDAAVANGIHVNYQGWEPVASNMPEGWKFLGEGCYRRAFLSPDGVVYKVEYAARGSNANEAEVFARFGHEVDGFRLAACTLFYDDVLAMEYVTHEWDCDYVESYNKAVAWTKTILDYWDVVGKTAENFHAVNGVVVLTDYAYDCPTGAMK